MKRHAILAMALALAACTPANGLGGRGPNPLPSGDLPIVVGPSPSPSPSTHYLPGPAGQAALDAFRPGAVQEGMAEAMAGSKGEGPDAWPPALPDRWWAKVAGMNRLADGRFPDGPGVVPLQLSGLRIDDAGGGNGDGVPNPGERFKLKGLVAPFPGGTPPVAVTLGFRLSTETAGHVSTTVRAGAGSGGTPFSVDLGDALCSGPSCFAFIDHGQEPLADADPAKMRLAVKIPVSLVEANHELELLGFRLEQVAGGYRLWPRVRNGRGSYSPPAKLQFEGEGLSGTAFLPPVDDRSDVEGHAGNALWAPTEAGGQAALLVTYSDNATQRVPFTLPQAADFAKP